MLNNKKVLRLIIILLIIAIVIGSILIIIKNNKKHEKLEEQEQAYIDSINNPGKIIDGEKPKLLKINNIFFTVEECMQKYYKYLNSQNTQAVYSLLDKEYIQNNNITLENALNKIPIYDNMDSYVSREIYVITGKNYSTFYVKTLLNKNEKYYILNMDSASNAFSIIPTEIETYNKKIDEVIESDKQYEDTIALNEYNKVAYIYLEEDDLVERYFQDYLNNALYNPEMAFELLDDEYKTKKFGSLEGYKQYIEKNKNLLSAMCKEERLREEDFEDETQYEQYYSIIAQYGLDKYKIEQLEGSKRIICIDTNGNYYIFNIKSIMNYTLMLDTYTIDLPEFVEKYNSSNEQQKVALNIDKFFQALNDKDYKYAYNCLADSYKNNYFKTQEEFEIYAKQNFYESSKVEYNKFNVEGEVYTYSVILTNEQTGEQMNKTFIMQLGEGTEFVLSFNE